MGRAKIKKKDTFIDMTAMSDVTVLLLTFFMLTSTFVKKEPVQVTSLRIGNQDSGDRCTPDSG
jgi:biopolymer transport protein ExbD